MKETYEYLVIDILKKCGSNIEEISKYLNILGAEGWHLVSANLNELDKVPFGIGGVPHKNKNIFIFERKNIQETDEV